MSGQIVWFFDRPTVSVCPPCERVAPHCTSERCGCGREWVSFTADPLEVEASREPPLPRGGKLDNRRPTYGPDGGE